MNGWGGFILAFAVFLASHSLPVRPRIKARLVGVIGARGFTLAYSALSVAMLVWLIVAAGRAPHVVLWAFAPWQAHVPLTVMALASVIVALALGRPNPLSFGGANDAAFDPSHPGLIGWMRHPLLVAIALWAGAHLVPNGDLAHILLFGVFLGFALGGMRLIDRRKRRLLGEDWFRLAATTARLEVTAGGLARVALGLGLYALLLWLHGPVIGVSPLP